ncbi:MAG: PQQ-binding-like beta-propeller repeat protein [Planctomycetaceae bacterium]
MPLLIPRGSNQQIVSPGGRSIISYDPQTGKEYWKILHRGWSIAPRPIYGNDLVYVMMDHDHPELWAIDPNGEGDVTNSHIRWKFTKSVPPRSTPILVEDLIYFVNRSGIISCIETSSGELVWKKRLEGNFSASPVYANGQLYFFNEEAAATVIKPGRDFKIVAENKLAVETLMASPAIAGDSLYVRTDGHLYRIDNPEN